MEDECLSKRELLYKAIEDNQQTIRFTDTKAAAVLVLIGLVATVIGGIKDELIEFNQSLLSINNHHWGFLLHVILAIIFIIGVGSFVIAILLAFKAISPKSGPIESINNDFSNAVPNTFYLMRLTPQVSLRNVFRDKPGYFKLEDSANLLFQNVSNIDDKGICEVLSLELLKVSYIREMKIQRVKRSFSFVQLGVMLFIILYIVTILFEMYGK